MSGGGFCRDVSEARISFREGSGTPTRCSDFHHVRECRTVLSRFDVISNLDSHYERNESAE